jgi:hypothetical protein
VALSYVVAPGVPGCDTEEELRELVKSDMGDDPFVPAGPPRHALRLSIAPAGRMVRGDVELSDAAGKVVLRESFVERSCARADDRMIVIVTHEVFPPPAEPPTCEDACTRDLSAKVAALERRVEALQKEVDDRTVRFMDLTYALSTGVLITANLTPNVGPGVWLGGELRAGPLSIGLELRSVLPSRVVVGPYDADLSQYVGFVVPCGRYSYFFGCVVAGAGAEVAHDSNGPSGPREAVDPLLQLGGRLGAELPFAANRLAVRAWGEVLWSTPSVDLHYGTEGKPSYVRWDRPDVSAFFGAGLVVKLGDEKVR